MWKTGLLHHIRFICKLCSIDRYAVFLTECKDLFCLCRMPWFVCTMKSRTVCYGNHKFCSDCLNKVKHTDPLFLGQHIQITFRHLAIAGSIKIIISLGRPGTGHTHPCRSQFLCQFAQFLIIEVDRCIDLHQILIHICDIFAFSYLKRLYSRDLLRCVCLPESSTRHFRKFNIIRHETWIHLTQSTQFFRCKCYKFCHFITFLSNIYAFILARFLSCVYQISKIG